MIVKLLVGSSGLNTVLDPVRLVLPETGISALTSCENIEIDDSFRVNRRKGYRKVVDASAPHSIYADKGRCYFVDDGAIYKLNDDLTKTGVRSGINKKARMSFCITKDKTYYCNGYENGVINDITSSPWVNEAINVTDTGKKFSDPPIGHLLAIWHGRMYIADENGIWFSEPFSYSQFRLSASFIPTEGKPTMMVPVDGGMFISDNCGVYFLSGADASAFSLAKKSEYSAVPGTGIQISGELMLQDVSGKCAIWCDCQGICLGTSDGSVRNLTEEKVMLPLKSSGGFSVIKGRHIIITI